MDEIKVARINELYKKAKNQGLNEDEKIEQQKLRREYIDSFKTNLKSQMGTVKIQDEQGNIRPIQRKKK